MEDSFVNAQKDSQEKDDACHNMNEDRRLLEEDSFGVLNSKAVRLTKRVDPRRALDLNAKHYGSNLGLDDKIPKLMVTVDEKYLRCCLELINMTASKPAQRVISVNLSTVKMGFSNGLNPDKFRSRETSDFDMFSDVAESVAISPANRWITGSIMGSKSMINILKSPLFHQLGISDYSTTNFSLTDLNNAKDLIGYDFMDSSSGLSLSSSQKLQKEASTEGRYIYGSDSAHKSFVSTSSKSPMCSSEQPCGSVTASRGMLQCTWKGGIPHFVFSADDRNEVYIANLLKVESENDKALNYVYLFHLGKNGQEVHQIHNNESQLVGKMKVSSSDNLCPNNSKTVETEFVLFGGVEKSGMEINSTSNNFRKIKGLSKKKKVAEVFKTKSFSSKRRSVSNFAGSSAVKDYCPWEPYQDTGNSVNAIDAAYLLESTPPPNFELAAIVINDHLHENPKHDVGGWGLKFLKKGEAKKTTDSLETSLQPECCARNSGNCYTSMNILIPAGLHGGPRMSRSGPSSLTERWRSGGHCDCGGWDLGCPLTVLKGQSNKEEHFSREDMQGECKSFDIYAQGSKHGPPTMRMMDIHNGLYFIHFQPTLSSLQSFAIAAAIIHSRSPTLKPGNIPASN